MCKADITLGNNTTKMTYWAMIMPFRADLLGVETRKSHRELYKNAHAERAQTNYMATLKTNNTT